MCRHLGYLGPPITLGSLLLAPEHSLLDQAKAPREQRASSLNADGFGVGWYDLDRRREPVLAACLAADYDLPAAPVHITQPEGRDQKRRFRPRQAKLRVSDPGKGRCPEGAWAAFTAHGWAPRSPFVPP